MGRVRVVTDSTADIPESLRRELGIEMVPLNVHFGPEVFKDQVDIFPDDFYARLPKTEHHPRTSQPSPGEFVETYKRIIEQGEDIVSIHISSKLSGTFQSATLAQNMLPDAPIEIVDSGLAAMVLGMVVLEAARAAQKGANQAEVRRVAEDTMRKTRVAFAVDTLEYLQRNGRIGKAAAFLGSLLGIRPLLTLSDGLVAPVEKIRGKSKVLPRVLEIIQEWVPAGSTVKAAITHAAAPEEAEVWKHEVSKIYTVEEWIVCPLGPVVGTHTGPGTVGVMFHEV